MIKNTIIVRSAIEIPNDLKEVLETKLKAKYSTKDAFEYVLDSSILVGLVVQVDDMEYHYDLRDQVDFILMELLK